MSKQKTLKDFVSEYTIEEIQKEVNRQVKSVLNDEINFREEIIKIYKEHIKSESFKKQIVTQFKKYMQYLIEDEYYNDDYWHDLMESIIHEGLKSIDIEEIASTPKIQKNLKSAVMKRFDGYVDLEALVHDRVVSLLEQRVKVVID